VKDGFELAADEFLFAPHTIWALISDHMATARNFVSENG